jgi:pimeloyl-ACP methyl ester carboxylesterase
VEALIRLSQASEDLLGRVTAIECRTLVMTGDLDPAAPPGDVDDLVATIGPSAQLRVVAGARHGVHRDQPEEFNDIVGAFLSKVESELA